MSWGRRLLKFSYQLIRQEWQEIRRVTCEARGTVSGRENWQVQYHEARKKCSQFKWVNDSRKAKTEIHVWMCEISVFLDIGTNVCSTDVPTLYHKCYISLYLPTPQRKVPLQCTHQEFEKLTFLYDIKPGAARVWVRPLCRGCSQHLETVFGKLCFYLWLIQRPSSFLSSFVILPFFSLILFLFES